MRISRSLSRLDDIMCGSVGEIELLILENRNRECPRLCDRKRVGNASKTRGGGGIGAVVGISRVEIP